MAQMNLRTTFRFTLPNGSGVKVEPGRKASGTMRLIKVKDLIDIDGDASVREGSNGRFFIALLTRTVTELGLSRMITQKTIEKLSMEDFAFLVDFMHEANHQIFKRMPLKCASCNCEYHGGFAQLGEV